MKKNIFAVKGDIIQVFNVTINEKLLKNVQSKIDNWNGKGDIKEVKAASLFDYYGRGKIEVISQKYAGKGDVFYYCCPDIETMDMYNYKFYQYVPHPLSELCDKLLKNYDSLDYSKYLAELLNWTSNNCQEMIFVRDLINAFKFKKVSIDEIVQSDLTIEEKKNILRRVMDAIKDIKETRKIIVAPKIYEDEVEKKIIDMEVFNSGFYARELRGEDFKYTEEQKIEVKKRILTTLPTTDSVINVNKIYK